MKIKTAQLTRTALDWAVFEAEKSIGRTDVYMRWFGDGRPNAPWCNGPFKPSTDWAQGGPIIESELDGWSRLPDGRFMTFKAGFPLAIQAWGPTLLIAAMRCYVASKLGDEVDVPDELVEVHEEDESESAPAPRG